MGNTASREIDANSLSFRELSNKHEILTESLQFLAYHCIDTILQSVDHRWYMTVHGSINFTQLGQNVLQELANKRLIVLIKPCQQLLDTSSTSPSELRLSNAGCVILNSIVRNDEEYAIVRRTILDCEPSNWYNDQDVMQPDYAVNEDVRWI